MCCVGPDGRVHCYEGTVEEITAEVQAQQSLQASREDLARLVDLMPGVIYKTRWTQDGRSREVTFVSAKLTELFGLNSAGRAGHKPDLVSSLRHPDDREGVRARVEAAVVHNLPLDIEFRMLQPQGGHRWVRMTSVRAPDEGGCKVRVGMLFDITDRRLAEQALREQGELWKRAMESTGDAVWDWDLETGVEVMSGNVAELYGYAPGELQPTPDTMDALTHPDDVAGHAPGPRGPLRATHAGLPQRAPHPVQGRALEVGALARHGDPPRRRRAAAAHDRHAHRHRRRQAPRGAAA
jgi:PAS domain S-box-containing protein